MEKLYYSISEVAAILDESASLVRFWTNRFEKFLKPHRNAKGNRMYTAEDIETLKQLHLLIKENGMTLDGAELRMKSERAAVEDRIKVLDSLKSIRSRLQEVSKLFN